MMVRIDHNGQEPAGPMAIALGYLLTFSPSLNRVVGEKWYCTTAELRYFVPRT